MGYICFWWLEFWGVRSIFCFGDYFGGFYVIYFVELFFLIFLGFGFSFRVVGWGLEFIYRLLWGVFCVCVFLFTRGMFVCVVWLQGLREDFAWSVFIWGRFSFMFYVRVYVFCLGGFFGLFIRFFFIVLSIFLVVFIFDYLFVCLFWRGGF